MSADHHHLLFDRRIYNASNDTRMLREDCGLIARIDRACHEEIHDNITTVPLPNRHMARVALNHMMPITDPSKPLDMMDQYMFAIQESVNNPRSNDLDKALGQLIIHSVYRQRPFIQEGLLKAKVIDLGGLGFRQVIDKIA